MTGRRLAWGAGAAAAYVAVAGVLLASGRPVLPLFDGLAPVEPYRWVEPPPEFEPTNVEALGGATRTPLEPESAITVITDDGQAQVSILTEDVHLPPNQRMAAGTITPVDPAAVGPPPEGLRFDSNAYEIDVRYLPSREPLALTGEATILLRYAAHATRLARWDEEEERWSPLDSTVLSGTLQVFGGSEELGTFVALGPIRRDVQQEEGPPWVGWAIAAGVGVAVGLAILAFVRWRRRRASASLGRRRGKR